MRFKDKTYVIRVSMDGDGNVRVTRVERHGWTLAAAVAMAVCSVAQFVSSTGAFTSGHAVSGVAYLLVGLSWVVLSCWYAHRWRHGK